MPGVFFIQQAGRILSMGWEIEEGDSSLQVYSRNKSNGKRDQWDSLY